MFQGGGNLISVSKPLECQGKFLEITGENSPWGLGQGSLSCPCHFKSRFSQSTNHWVKKRQPFKVSSQKYSSPRKLTTQLCLDPWVRGLQPNVHCFLIHYLWEGTVKCNVCESVKVVCMCVCTRTHTHTHHHHHNHQHNHHHHQQQQQQNRTEQNRKDEYWKSEKTLKC